MPIASAIALTGGLDFFEIIGMREGFDIVIGNPPYGVKVSDAVKDEFSLGSKDSYGVFTSLGLKILKPGGTLSFIMSDTWQTIRTHKELRDQLLSQTDVQYLISVPNDTFAATVNPGVYSFIKRLKPEQGGDNWILAADFSPLSIEKGDVETAFELLMEQDMECIDRVDASSVTDTALQTKDGDTICSDREMAIFAYRQKLIPRFSNHIVLHCLAKALWPDVRHRSNEI
ncbi:MAG: Eco57I restriction-modification methylase domain-containing protein [Candidatus Desantisbacteria bacterium]